MSETHGEREMEEVISRLLLTGVALAAAVVAAGGALYLVRHGGEAPQLGTFRSEPSELRTLGGVIHAVGAGEARAVIQLGLGLLVATPVARVAFALVAFLRQRDLLYAGVTSLVLAVLLASLLSAALSR